MDQKNDPILLKYFVMVAGLATLALAIANLGAEQISIGLALIVIFAVIIAPRMSLTLPRARFAISFGDASVFLAFLIYGGWTAIIIAGLETLSNCIYLRRKGLQFGRRMIITNVSVSLLSFGITYLVYLSVPSISFVNSDPTSTQYLIVTLGALAFVHFLASSMLAAIIQSLRQNLGFLTIWLRDCFSSSMTHIVGAGLAGLVYTLVNFGDLITGTIVFAALGVAYLSYRQSIEEINSAMNQAEIAERQKAETEKVRRREAEDHAAKLSKSLERQELAFEALRRSEQDFQHAALHDSLTRLPNRKHLGDVLRQAIAEYTEDPSRHFHVLFLDIQRFKNINDTLGHSIGDKVLSVAAKRFTRMLDPADTVARIGGDEFAVILRGVSSNEKALKVARRMLKSISQPFSLSGNRISLTLNIGVASCDEEYSTPEQILRDADIAMHHAKERKLGVAMFTRELRSRFLERVRLEMDLASAIDNKELSMSYQPLIDLRDGSLMGFEALLRWNHSEIGPIPPNKFIPIAEESGLIIPITRWILEETTRQLSQWQSISHTTRDLIVSVNISGKHLSNDDLIADVENALTRSGIDPHSLKLEITESAAMDDPEHSINMLRRLKQTGVQLSIDDFGTGYSSLAYLHRLPFDTLKIDRSFVSSVGEKGENSEIIQTVIALAKNLKMRVIAEGIETESQYRILRNLGCDYGQGYLMSRPLTVENAETALYERKNWAPTGYERSESDGIDVVQFPAGRNGGSRARGDRRA